MNLPQFSQENREALAHEVLDSWEFQDLMLYALTKLIEDYNQDDNLFLHDWEHMQMKERKIA